MFTSSTLKYYWGADAKDGILTLSVLSNISWECTALPFAKIKLSITSDTLLQNIYTVSRLLYSHINISTRFKRYNSIKLTTDLFIIYWSYLRYVYKIYSWLQIKQGILWIGLAENRNGSKMFNENLPHSLLKTLSNMAEVVQSRYSDITYKQTVVLYNFTVKATYLFEDFALKVSTTKSHHQVLKTTYKKVKLSLCLTN
jgi:hypothetical protein